MGATIKHHLDLASEPLQESAALLKDSLYVDNCVASLDSASSLQRFVREARSLLESAQFDLRGWRSNAPSQVLREVTDDCFDDDLDSERCTVSVLGLLWDLRADTLKCDLRDVRKWYEPPATKRKILAAAHRLFDPVGFTSPVSILPKIQLQECWRAGVNWDEPLPSSSDQLFQKWITELPELEEIRIPRWLVGQPLQAETLSLHVFCDASLQAYAACVFHRVGGPERVSCQLVQARSRVAPLKKVTIPQLELLACTMD